MKIKGEHTYNNEEINTPEQFIEDLCNRINGFTGKIINIHEPEMELMMLKGFIEGISNRLNRVCEG